MLSFLYWVCWGCATLVVVFESFNIFFLFAWATAIPACMEATSLWKQIKDEPLLFKPPYHPDLIPGSKLAAATVSLSYPKTSNTLPYYYNTCKSDSECSSDHIYNCLGGRSAGYHSHDVCQEEHLCASCLGAGSNSRTNHHGRMLYSCPCIAVTIPASTSYFRRGLSDAVQLAPWIRRLGPLPDDV